MGSSSFRHFSMRVVVAVRFLFQGGRMLSWDVVRLGGHLNGGGSRVLELVPF